MRGQRSTDANIDLGLAVSALSLAEGQSRSCEEIAAFCGVSKAAIQKIEAKAFRKFRQRGEHLREELFA